MLNGTLSRFQAIQSFDEAVRQARWGQVWRWLTGRPRRLLSFADFQEVLLFSTPRDLGIRDVPLEKITGSVGRAKDFDRSFRPLNESLRERWVQILNLHRFTGWEPIVLYKVGDIYFVQDGHHRVSVARQVGVPSIEAHVLEYPTVVCLSPRDSAEHLLGKLRAAMEPAPITAAAAGCHNCC